MTREAKSSIIQNVLASVIVQALVLGTAALIFYGRLEAKLASYDEALSENSVVHKELGVKIDGININGTARGQPIYSDIADMKERVGAMERKDAATQVRLDWIMSSLERIERQSGLIPQPRPKPTQ